MKDTGLDITRHVESVCMVLMPPGVLRLLVPGVAVGVIMDHHWVADGVEVTLCVISAMQELFSEDEGVEF
jgi:hypothetical protein